MSGVSTPANGLGVAYQQQLLNNSSGNSVFLSGAATTTSAVDESSTFGSSTLVGNQSHQVVSPTGAT